MEKRYEITEKQLTFLENYLKKKFSDPEDLYELIDHIILDFEVTTQNGNLSQYLADNSSFIFNYKGSSANKESTIHWQYQRELWQVFFSLFYHLKKLPITTLALTVIYYLFFRFNLSNKIFGIIFFSLMILSLIMSFVFTYHKNKGIKKLISFKCLSNVMALPNTLLYLSSLALDYLKENKILFFIYIAFALCLHISAIILIREKRNNILEKYKHLLY